MTTNIFLPVIEDHDKIKTTIKDIEQSLAGDGDDLKKLFQTFKQLFHDHDKMEDEIMYPELMKHAELKKLILKGYQAHHMAEMGILELRLLPYQSETWGPKFLVIKDSILAHMEEEEKIIMEKAKKLLNKAEIESLGNQLADYYE